MSLPAIFFTTDEATARCMELNHALPAADVLEMSAIDTLKMSTLWAIIDGRPWDVDSMDAFTEIFARESEWLYRVPDVLAQKLTQLEPSQLARVAAIWAATDEMKCTPSEAEEIMEAIAEVAARAIQTHRPLFLFTCL